GFLDTFRMFYPDTTEAYTWWTAWSGARERNVGWRIDYWMASAKLADKIQDATIHPDVMGSDHCPVSIKIG
ncbi:MAG: exodeoxyribonuclease III, partial [Candidatus Saccharibacteria bacterium]|nr:exodeoxyribonuclease III [Candidatus Saccharibacteria bacterium]